MWIKTIQNRLLRPARASFKCYSRSTSSGQSPSNELKFPRKIFSGVQPTGSLHIGNYFGAIKRWVDLQESGEDVTYCIVDLHSITLPQDPVKLRNRTLQLTAILLACGIDTNRATLFLQSSVPQHTELGWILGCMSTMARLAHLPQFKEKSALLKDVPLGLMVYPVLQSADIMLYKATHVPVGEDQVQHLQLAHHLAKIFNTKYGETFPLCHSIVADDPSCRIKSLRDPKKKMSKSDPDTKSCVLLTDTPEQVTEKVKKAITDFTSEVTFDPVERPGVANLITIHSLASGLSAEQICTEAAGIDTGKYKLRVAEALVAHLEPIRQKINDYSAHPEFLESVLIEGAEKAGMVAEATMVEVKDKIGLRNLKGLKKDFETRKIFN